MSVASAYVIVGTKMNALRHRRWKRIALFIGIPLLLLVCVAIVLLVVSTPKEEVVASRKRIPSDWLAPPPSQTESLALPEGIESASASQQLQPTDKNLSGRLAVMANGKRFGEESYELRVTSDHGVRLTSRGTFSFKVLFAAVKALFSQNVSLDPNLRPDRYSLDIDGPLGIGSLHVQGAIAGDVARVISGDQKKEIRIESAEPLVLGTFSTYAFIPLLMRARESDGALEFQVIPLLRGKAKDNDAGNSDHTILLRIERTGNRVIRTGSGDIIADKYVLTSNIGNSTLLARGDEFLALIATSDKGSLVAYRSDFFPDGVNLSQ